MVRGVKPVTFVAPNHLVDLSEFVKNELILRIGGCPDSNSDREPPRRAGCPASNSGRGLPQSKTLRVHGDRAEVRQLLDCASPPALFEERSRTTSLPSRCASPRRGPGSAQTLLVTSVRRMYGLPMLNRLVPVILFSLSGFSVAFADTLQLKDHAVISGKILARKHDQIVVDLGYTVLVVPRNQIEKIVESASADLPVRRASMRAVQPRSGSPVTARSLVAVPRDALWVADAGGGTNAFRWGP